MISTQLSVFLTVADCGSFSKAAERLFISPTAVMKQINTLESRLGFPLLTRSSHGVRLTPAGEIICKDAQFLTDYAAQSIENARRAMTEEPKVFRVGTSMLNPAKPFMDLWYQMSETFPNHALNLVPFEDDHNGILAEIARIGEKYDFLVAACDSDAWLEKCNMLLLGHYEIMCAVPRGHHLAQKELLTPSDLSGETVLMVAAGDSTTNDAARRMLEEDLHVRIEDTAHFYDISVFNRCAETGSVLLTLSCWKDVHPALVTIPVDWAYAVPYGLLYAQHPPAHIERFVRTLAQHR
ncbi:transcriptional regulator, LysR family [Selenomonas sp. FOBRC9]|uniref:LysR family transcriptional regulator n=1 Tax=Selenomonas sp. FOBRC9 TaxID=936573 RepID=UPI00027A410A|nr:LysR family transcriptional regulator [Selenomonas sp. FOBRC9]EJP33113.1 transcriptional regulator, LysR family [Selenomonas sp. FOBRC9]